MHYANEQWFDGAYVQCLMVGHRLATTVCGRCCGRCTCAVEADNVYAVGVGGGGGAAYDCAARIDGIHHQRVPLNSAQPLPIACPNWPAIQNALFHALNTMQIRTKFVLRCFDRRCHPFNRVDYYILYLGFPFYFV